MTEPLSLQQKIVGKLRAVGTLVRILFRLLLHPGELIRLYQRESNVADSVLDIALISLEHEFQERIDALEARVAELEAQGARLPEPIE
jgi:hypothetical protein